MEQRQSGQFTEIMQITDAAEKNKGVGWNSDGVRDKQQR